MVLVLLHGEKKLTLKTDLGILGPPTRFRISNSCMGFFHMENYTGVKF